MAIIHPRWRLLLLAILKNFIESSFNCQQIHRSHHLLWQFEMKTLSNLVWIDARLNKKHESFTIRSEKTSYWDVVSCKKALCVYISLWRPNLKKISSSTSFHSSEMGKFLWKCHKFILIHANLDFSIWYELYGWWFLSAIFQPSIISSLWVRLQLHMLPYTVTNFFSKNLFWILKRSVNPKIDCQNRILWQTFLSEVVGQTF